MHGQTKRLGGARDIDIKAGLAGNAPGAKILAQDSLSLKTRMQSSCSTSARPRRTRPHRGHLAVMPGWHVLLAITLVPNAIKVLHLGT